MTENKLTTKLKEAVKVRAANCCEYCYSQEKFATQGFSIEHIYPLSGEIIPLYHPRQQNWSDHFSWSDDYTLMIGLTPVGRITVEVLRLNRKGLVNLRRILYAMGEHPPS